MYLSRTSAPATTPVSLAEAKSQLRVDFTDDDVMISALIDAATLHFDARDGVLGRALVTQSWDYRIDAFPRTWPFAIELPFPPLVSVASVKYLDGAGVERTLTANTDYVVEIAEFVGRIRPAYNTDWPDTLADFNAVRIAFTCGYGAAASVPAPIRQAILLHVQKHYDRNLDASAQTALMSCIEALAGPFRMRKI
jgi:uncharacterized phiE125 gp8 family phage protein